MALTDKLQTEKTQLESYLDSERGAKLEQNQLDRLEVINSLLGIDNSNSNDATFTLTSESGFLTYRNTAVTNTAVQVKATAGSLMGWNFINANTSAVYVKFYDQVAASVVVGTTPVVLTLAIPAGSATNPAIFFQSPDLIPIEVFSTAISYAVVTGLADSNTTAPTTAIHTSVRYK